MLWYVNLLIDIGIIFIAGVSVLFGALELARHLRRRKELVSRGIPVRWYNLLASSAFLIWGLVLLTGWAIWLRHVDMGIRLFFTMGFYDLVSYFHAKYATIFIVHDSGDFDSGFSKKVRKQE
jgi:hypothetical protein